MHLYWRRGWKFMVNSFLQFYRDLGYGLLWKMANLQHCCTSHGTFCTTLFFRIFFFSDRSSTTIAEIFGWMCEIMHVVHNKFTWPKPKMIIKTKIFIGIVWYSFSFSEFQRVFLVSIRHRCRILRTKMNTSEFSVPHIKNCTAFG